MYEAQNTRQFPPFWRVLAGLLLAPALAAIAMSVVSPAYDGLPDMIERVWRTAEFYAVFGAYPTAVLVGVPTYFVLRRHFRPTILNCAWAGALVAAFPWIVLTFVVKGADQASVNDRPTVIDGVMTAYGWLLRAETIAQIAAFGLFGGLVFWAVTVLGWRGRNVR